MEKLKSLIRDVPDFPKEGIIFKDITTLLKDPEGLKKVIDILVDRYKSKDIKYIVGIESRGFIFGPSISYELGLGFIPVRKPGKLPAETLKVDYSLEYGTNTLEIHRDALEKGDKVVIVDDLLATGGTAKATAELIEKLGGKVEEFAFPIELEFLKGRNKLSDYNVFSIMKY